MVRQRFQNAWLLGALSLLAWAGSTGPGFALDNDPLQNMLSYPPRLQWLEPGAVLPDSGIVTPYTISDTELTIPSLWWMQEQYGGDLLSGWIAYPAMDGLPPRVDLVVNESVWRSYSYWERFSFVMLFGRESQQFGYLTRVFNEQRPQPRALAAYLCNPIALEDMNSPPRVIDERCQVFMGVPGTGIGPSTTLEERFRAY
jgi:hypothetical protein